MKRELIVYPLLELERMLEYKICGQINPNINLNFKTNTLAWCRYFNLSEKKQDKQMSHIGAGRKLSTVNLQWEKH